jgi:predicted AAA+ superfamily ATPase
MEREQITFLKRWKESKNRKPLLIKGARQVGKTWLMKTFGKEEYEQCVYVNFESNSRLKTIFTDDFNIQRILLALQIETGITIEAPDTLIIFDEIQEAPGAITSLKYFYENAPEYHIISAGSLLGVALTKNTSFPVGKVDFLNLYPLNYGEYLEALGKNRLADLLKTNDWELIKSFKSEYIELLKQYYYIGGMPEAVFSFSENKDFKEVRTIQQRILMAYEQDFSKHAPNEIVPRIRMLWNSIPAQLAKENKKFIYGIIKQGARAKDYEMALAWLIDCGLLHKVNRVSKPALPLKAYEDFSAFKLFLVDVGLLAAMGNLDAGTLLDGYGVFEEFKGALTEQYVLQQLITIPDMNIHYWSAENARAEIDFLVQFDASIAPIEVKAEENLQSKSLRVFYQKYNPKISVRTSMSDFRKEDWLTSLPLYAISELQKLLG